MAALPGDVKIVSIQRKHVAQGGTSVWGYELQLNVMDKAAVTVAIAGDYPTTQQINDAIHMAADPIVDALKLYQ